MKTSTSYHVRKDVRLCMLMIFQSLNICNTGRMNRYKEVTRDMEDVAAAVLLYMYV